MEQTWNLRMPRDLKQYYLRELQQYQREMESANLLHAWYHLERAHILGQAWPFEHSYTHWLMLKFGWKTRDMKEVLGQILRLLIGGTKSFLGKVPTGNTGGANVSPLRSMRLPSDLRELLKTYS